MREWVIDVTLLGVLGALWRSWPLVVTGLMTTGLAVLGLVAPAPLYRTTTEVQFSAPPGAPQLGDPSRDLVPFASLVERVHSDGARVSPLSSTTAPLNGTGVREGVSVRLPNSGTQWGADYAVPNLTVEVVAESEARLLDLHAEAVKSILATARELQSELGVPEAQMAVAVEEPEQPEVSYVGSRRGGQARAVAAMLIVGTGLTAFAAVTVDRYRHRRLLAGSDDNAPPWASGRTEPARAWGVARHLGSRP